MSYFKYLSKDRKAFFSHSAKILGVGVVLLSLLKIIIHINLTWGEMGLVLLEGAGGLILIWLIYVIIEYFHYRKIK